ncbi:MBL fold metallo-hydrolase [Salinarchaeum sp. IM2453]|uniref:MBL fold metallo-hydrolase n=1 Tax=Salinarchaeum sp. IM2453 TaxID=2862870 RepID=UPI001C835A01|nr:MBL fold metallo-hydrolase [Salinarchaeum sp. IM2453]QZA89454.1 MBL fold metallo-hydrolase [Salinarchaeum sp. IM2453]
MQRPSREQFPAVDAQAPSIDPKQFKQRLDRGEELTLLDTRRPNDFEEWKITHRNLSLVNIPFSKFLDNGQPAPEVPEGVPDGPLVVSCGIGVSSQYVGEFLASHGWDVSTLENGMEGWARVHERFELECSGSFRLFQYHRPSSGCLSYLIVDNSQAAVIDPLNAFTDQYLNDVKKFDASLTYAIDTHVHADHLSGVPTLAGTQETTAVYPTGAIDRGLTYDGEFVSDGDTITLDTTTIQAVHLPGHTSEMTGYRVGDFCLTGDSIFLEGVARPDLEDPDLARDAAYTLYDTLTHLQQLPSDTLIAPAHTSSEAMPSVDNPAIATIQSLQQSQPLLNVDVDTFVEKLLTDMPPRPNNYEEIITVNLGTRSVDKGEAFELELGPNNCAAGSAAD